MNTLSSPFNFGESPNSARQPNLFLYFNVSQDSHQRSSASGYIFEPGSSGLFFFLSSVFLLRSSATYLYTLALGCSLFADKTEFAHTGRSLTSESSAVSLNIEHTFIFTGSEGLVSATRVSSKISF